MSGNLFQHKKNLVNFLTYTDYSAELAEIRKVNNAFQTSRLANISRPLLLLDTTFFRRPPLRTFFPGTSYKLQTLNAIFFISNLNSIFRNLLQIQL